MFYLLLNKYLMYWYADLLLWNVYYYFSTHSLELEKPERVEKIKACGDAITPYTEVATK